MPDVKRLSSNGMVEMASGKELPTSINKNTLKIYGLYNFEKKAVFLLDSIDLKTDNGRAILLHELVHFLQYHDGVDKEVRCKNELEKLAYTLEARFMHDMGKKTSFSVKHVSRVSQCK